MDFDLWIRDFLPADPHREFGWSKKETNLVRETHLLIEAKTVLANSEFAVREAIGQLMTYEFIYYPDGARKVALSQHPSVTSGSNCLRNFRSMRSGSTVQTGRHLAIASGGSS